MAATRGQPEVRHTTSNTHVNGQRSPDRSTGKPPSVCPKPAEICANIFNYISLPAWSGKNTRTVFLHFLVCSYFFGMILYINCERVLHGTRALLNSSESMHTFDCRRRPTRTMKAGWHRSCEYRCKTQAQQHKQTWRKG